MGEQTPHNLLLNLLRAPPDIRSTADIKPITWPFGRYDKLTFGKAETQGTNKPQTRSRLRRDQIYFPLYIVARVKHRGRDLAPDHIHSRLLPLWNPLKRHRLPFHDTAYPVAPVWRVEIQARLDRPERLEIG